MTKVWTVVAVLAVAALLAACGGGPSTPADSPTPSGSPTPSVTSTPEDGGPPGAFDGIEVQPLKLGAEAALPDDIALIVEMGCTQCDGPTEGFSRVYRDPSGELRVEELLKVQVLGLPPRLVADDKAPDGTVSESPYFTGFTMTPDASEIIVSICTRGFCGGLGYADGDAEATLFRSRDGGVRWSPLDTLDGGFGAVAMADRGVVLSSNTDPLQDSGPRFIFYPSGEPVTPAPGGFWPVASPEGDLLWATQQGNRLLHSDGSPFLDFGPDTVLAYYGRVLEANPGGNRLLVSWWVETPDQVSSKYHMGLVDSDGRLVEAFTPSSPELSLSASGPWLDDRRVFGSAFIPPELLSVRRPEPFFGSVPVIVELDSGLIRPIPHPFVDPPYLNGRNPVAAVMRGPFARVVGTGSCLNVRAEPGAGAKVLGCAVDGVLLRDSGEAREESGTTWLRVETPGGVEGWASTASLER